MRLFSFFFSLKFKTKNSNLHKYFIATGSQAKIANKYKHPSRPTNLLLISLLSPAALFLTTWLGFAINSPPQKVPCEEKMSLSLLLTFRCTISVALFTLSPFFFFFIKSPLRHGNAHTFILTLEKSSNSFLKI